MHETIYEGWKETEQGYEPIMTITNYCEVVFLGSFCEREEREKEYMSQKFIWPFFLFVRVYPIMPFLIIC